MKTAKAKTSLSTAMLRSLSGPPALLPLLFLVFLFLHVSVARIGAVSASRTVGVRTLSTTPSLNFLRNSGYLADCPPCEPSFNCLLPTNSCSNFADCNSLDGTCLPCPDGFGGLDCRDVVCGSLFMKARPKRTNLDDYCTCSDGWGGGLCNVCLNNNACNTTSTPDYICVQDGVPQQKKYTWCSVESEILNSLVPGFNGSASFECDGVAKTCLFQVWDRAKELFYCKLDQCTFTTGDGTSSTSTCSKINCSCYDPVTCGDIIPGLLANIKDQSSLVCKDTANCVFHETNVDLLIEGGIPLVCISGECAASRVIAVPDYTPGLNLPLVGGIVFAVLMTIFLIYISLRCFIDRQKTLMSGASIQILSDEDMRLMEGRTQPGDLSFLDVSYQIGSKVVLECITGRIKPGETMAIMGPSGAGKSSFLDILAMKPKRGTVSGRILVNGKTPSKKDFRYISGYVDQEDVLMGTLTVRETLMYSAMLRLPRTLSLDAKRRRVQDTIEELGILHIADSHIGSPGQRGISGGEKRRVSIGQELVTSPSILFLDEPTSGLDSFSAHMVIECVTKLAKKSSRTVVFTIHQPRSNIFQMFDNLLLLAKGKVIYSGPAQEAVNYFAGIGFTCPIGFNIADYLIDIIAQNPTDGADSAEDDQNRPAPRRNSFLLSNIVRESEPILSNPDDGPESPVVEEIATSNRLHNLIEAYQNSELSTEIKEGIARIIASQNEYRQGGDVARIQEAPAADSSPNPSASFFEQVQILSGRTFINLYRNPFLLLAHFGISLILAYVDGRQYQLHLTNKASVFPQTFYHTIAAFCLSTVVCGTLFWKVSNDLPGVQNRLGCLFFMCALLAFGSLSSLELFASERILFVRERANGFYTPLAYFIAKVTMDIIPLRMLPPLLMGAISYYMIGLNPGFDYFARFLLVLVLFNLVAAGLCLIVGTTFRETSVANLVASLMMLFCMLFGGFLLNKDNMPAGLAWIQYLSFFNYGFESLIVNELSTIQLEDKGIVDVKIPGKIILVRFGFNPDGYWSDVGNLCYLFIITLTISFLCLKFLVKETR